MPENIAERFARDTKDHQMQVLRDDGLYRHLRFRRPRTQTSAYWFDLITWPGRLTVDGDCGTFTFARLTDMFEFFRGGRINPGYWAEKIQSAGHGPPQDLARTCSEDLFRKLVFEEIAQVIRDGHAPRGIGREIKLALRDWYEPYHEDGARAFLQEFNYATYRVSCPCGAEASHLSESVAGDWCGLHRRKGHAPRMTEIARFQFSDTWEWNLADWDWQFLWCCHAIQWGISQYDQQYNADEVAAYAEKAEREAPVNA
jgi:hypothetical protein